MKVHTKRVFLSFTTKLKNREKNAIAVQPQDSGDSEKSPSAQDYDNSRRKIDKSPITHEYDNSRNRIDRSPIAHEYDNSGNRRIDRSPITHEYDNSIRKIDRSPVVHEYDNSGNGKIDRSPIAHEYDNSGNRRIDRSPIAHEYDNSRNRRIDRSPIAHEYDNSIRKIDRSPIDRSSVVHEYDNRGNRRIDRSPIAHEYDNSIRKIGRSPIAHKYDNSGNRRIDKSPIAHEHEHDNSTNRRIDRSPNAQDYDKNNIVRVVHRGGSMEIFHQPLNARVLMEAYPDYVVTRPDVFQRPKDSILNPDDVLMLGNTFYLLSRKGVHKLLCKERMNQKKNNNNSSSNIELSASKDLPASKKPMVVASAMTYVTQFISTAKEFYGIHRDHRHGGQQRIGGLLGVSELNKIEDCRCENGEKQSEGNKWQFVPPLDDFEFYKDFSWRPKLPVIPELSP